MDRARPFSLVVAVTLMLAACGPDAPIAKPEKEAEAAAPAADRAPAQDPPATALSAASSDEIAEPFRGRWDRTAETCRSAGVYRLEIGAREMRFHESVARVRSVAQAGPGRIAVEADWEGEGQSWQATRELVLSDDGERLTVSGDGTSMERVRCR